MSQASEAKQQLQSLMPTWQWATTLVLTLVFGIIGFTISRQTGLDGILTVLKFVLFYSTIFFGAIIWIVFRHFIMHSALEDTKSLLAANQDNVKLRAVAGDEAATKLIDAMIDSMPKIRAMQRDHVACQDGFVDDIVRQRLDSIVAALNDSLRSLADGVVEIRDESLEITTNFEFLKQIPKKTVRAVSYQDEKFWGSDQGKNFLFCNENAISKGIAIQTIFILREPLDAVMGEIVEAQATAGISVLVVEAQKLSSPATRPEDFVIYDDLAVRAATLVTDDPRTAYEDKTAKLHLGSVKSYLARFEAIKNQAIAYSRPQP